MDRHRQYLGCDIIDTLAQIDRKSDEWSLMDRALNEVAFSAVVEGHYLMVEIDPDDAGYAPVVASD